MLVHNGKGSIKLILALYVDDGLVAATDETALLELTQKIEVEFKITTKPATYFLGIETDEQSDGCVKIHQSGYTEKLLKQLGMSECRPCVTLIISFKKAVDNGNTETDSVKVPYRSAAGALMYPMTGTRTDIAYDIGVVSRNLEKPTRSDVTQVKRIVRYLRGTTDVGIVHKCHQNSKALVCCSDADHAGDKTSGRSTTGVICMYSGGAISWLSQQQVSVAISPLKQKL